MKNKILTFSFLLFSMLILTGCSSTIRPSESILPQPENYIIPEIGIENTVYIGESLITEGTMLTFDAIILNSFHGTVGLSACHPIGEYILIGKNGNLLIYQFGETVPNGWVWDAEYPQLLEDSNGIVYRSTLTGKEELNSNDYTREKVSIDGGAAFEQRLIYTGAEGNILKFTYREFVDDLARSAFSIDATYDMSKDTLMRFKGMSLEVLNFDNQSITYKLRSGFKN